MADNNTTIDPGREDEAPGSSLSPLPQDLPGTQSMIANRCTLPLGIVLEEVKGLCIPTHPFTRAYINFQRLTEDFGINVYTGSFRKYKLSRTQTLVVDILHEWVAGRLRSSTDPVSGSVLEEVLQQIAVFAGSIIKEDVWTRENDRFCLTPSQVLAGDIPNIHALNDSIYTTSLWRLFFLEFYFNKNDIDDKFLGELHSYRQYCLCLATTQRVSLAFLPELKDYPPRVARELGGKVVGEPDIGSSLEFCPWLRTDSSTLKDDSSYDEKTCPRFLWDIEAQKTVDASNFEEMPSYRIISHTWGRWGKRDSDNKPISCPISSVPWPVPQNTLFNVDQLPEMLKKIQDYPGIQYVWIDLLCIPQYGASEEFQILTAKEIAKQAQIFKNAIFPILWLNNIEDWSSTKAAIEWISMEFVLRNVTLIDRKSIQLVESKLNMAKEKAMSTGFGDAKMVTESVQIEVDSLTEEGKLMFVVIRRKLPPTLMIIKTFEEFLDVRESVEDNYDLFVEEASETNGKKWETQLAFSQTQGTPYVVTVRRGTALGKEYLQFNNLGEATDFILLRLSLVNTDDSYDWAGSGNNRMILIGTATDLVDMKEGSKQPPKTLQGSEQIAEFFSKPSNIDPSATVVVEFKPMSPDEALEIINLLQGSGGPQVITLSTAAAAEHAEDAEAAAGSVDAENTDDTKAIDDVEAADGDEPLNLFLSRFSTESGQKYQDLLYKTFGSVGFIDEQPPSGSENLPTVHSTNQIQRANSAEDVKAEAAIQGHTIPDTIDINNKRVESKTDDNSVTNTVSEHFDQSESKTEEGSQAANRNPDIPKEVSDLLQDSRFSEEERTKLGVFITEHPDLYRPDDQASNSFDAVEDRGKGKQSESSPDIDIDLLREAIRMQKLSSEVQKSGGILNVIPCGWFTSLWTLQEACLRPDMLFYNRDFERLQLGDCKRQLSLDSLSALLQTWHGSMVQVKELGGPEGYKIEIRGQDLENIPIGVQEIFGAFTVSGLIDLIDLSALDILSLGRQRICKSSKVPALVAVLGIESWYMLHASEFERGADKEEKVLDLYPLSFLEAIREKYGAEFFCSRQSRARQEMAAMKTYPDRPMTVWSQGNWNATGSLLPIRYGCKIPRWRSNTLVDHSSVASWNLLPHGNVEIARVAILAASWINEPEGSIQARISLQKLYESEENPIRVGLAKDLPKVLQHMTSNINYPFVAVVVRYDSADERYAEGVILRSIDHTNHRWFKQGTFETTSESKHKIPESTEVDWLVL